MKIKRRLKVVITNKAKMLTAKNKLSNRVILAAFIRELPFEIAVLQK